MLSKFGVFPHFSRNKFLSLANLVPMNTSATRRAGNPAEIAVSLKEDRTSSFE